MDLAIEIVRFVSWNPQPGVVACELKDAEGRIHILADKIPIFTASLIDERSHYPLPGSVRCSVLNRGRDAQGRELVRVRTHGVETPAGLSEFVVLQEQLSTENAKKN